MFLEPVVAMTTGGDGDGDACLDAYGARCLLAATRDATLDDVSVANTVAVPTLVWCLDAATRGDGDGDDTHAELALAVEALRAFTPAYAATWGPDGGEGWTTLARCAVAPSPPAARAAAFAQMTPEFVSALAPAARAAALNVLFAAVNADAEETSRREARRRAPERHERWPLPSVRVAGCAPGWRDRGSSRSASSAATCAAAAAR